MKKTKYKKIYRAVTAAGMALVLTACSGGAHTDQPGGGKWQNSDITGNIKDSDDIRLQDDFAAAVNKDFTINAKNGDSSFGAVNNTMLENKKKLVDSLSYDGEGGELKKYAELAGDWNTRNKLGVEPIRKYIEAIENISSLDELTAYQCSEADDPFALGVIMPTGKRDTLEEGGGFALDISMPELCLGSSEEYFSLSDEGYEKKKHICKITEHILGELGYDSKSIQNLLDKNFRFEKKLAKCKADISAAEKDKVVFDYDGCIAEVGDYPLEAILTARGVPKSGKFYVNIHSIKKLVPLYKEKNLDEIKAMLIVHTVKKSASYLDRETYDLEEELKESRLTEPMEEVEKTEEQAELTLLYDVFVAQSACEPILDKLYLEKYMDEDTVKDLEKLTDDIIDEYRTLFENEPWLSEEGKKLCIEKLDSMQPHVVVPDFDMLDYSGLNIRSGKDGGTFFEANLDAERYGKKLMYKNCSLPYDKSKWDPMGQSTLITNAFYKPTENAIYIMAGITASPIYSYDMTYEQKLGGLGAIVGHEITHGFDSTGERYNKDGVEKKWLPLQDEMEFSNRSLKVTEYYNTIYPFDGGSSYDGMLVSGEATADMGGLKIALSIASREKDFDYDMFFRQFADLWKISEPEEAERARFKMDAHPLNYLRINVSLQQFEEFYKTYGIQEGDGMYLAEEKRISVW